MNRKMVNSIFILLLLIPVLLTAQNNDSREIKNLRAFAKLYGYVRFFHPSDESASLDWDKFATFGAKSVLNAKNENELKETLKKLFLPVAPAAQIYGANEKPADVMELFPKNIAGLKVTSWQHYGIGLTKESPIYKSIRLNRAVKSVSNGNSSGILRQVLNAKPFRGKEVMMTAFVKAETKGDEDNGYLWFRTNNEKGDMLYIDNMFKRPIQSPEWKEYSIQHKIEDEAETIYFGCIATGEAKVWYDDFKMFVKNENKEWIPITIINPGFEEEITTGGTAGWLSGPVDFKYVRDDKELKTGKYSFFIGPKEVIKTTVVPKLFNDEAKIGEVIEKSISDGLMCRIPLALYCDSTHTIGGNSNYSLEFITAGLEKTKAAGLNANLLPVRLGNTIIAWNILQHFYPYFDVVNADWDNVLTETLSGALKDKTSDEFYDTLRKMIAKIQDGHGVVYYQREKPIGGFKIRVELIENNIVVTGSQEAELQKGDIIKSIDGKTGLESLAETEKFVSGAPQLRRYRTLNQFGQGETGSTADIEVIRNNETLKIKKVRAADTRNLFFSSIPEFTFPTLKEVDPGIYYVNTRISKKEFNDNIQKLADAKGVIIDWRWDGKYDPDVKSVEAIDFVAYAAGSMVRSANWNIPTVIYPDRENIKFSESFWPLPAKKPHFKGTVVFITEPSVVSYGETCMGIVENFKLAETVGVVTAGTNGNVNFINLPGGYKIMWTGMRVLKHDHSQHHIIGIKPTYPVERTIKAVKEGRDEYLENAIEVIKSKIK